METSVAAGWPVRFAVATLGIAALAVLGDQVHVRTDTLSYRHPTALGQPWWVIPEFIGAGLGGLVLIWALSRRLGQAEGRPGRSTLVAVALFGCLYAATGLLHDQTLPLCGLLVGAFAAQWLAWREDALMAAAVGLAMAVGGPLAEAALSSTGTFVYHSANDLLPGLGRVPVWLPLLYLNTGFMAAKLWRWIR